MDNALFIGGPLHGKITQCIADKYIIPVWNNEAQPKQQRIGVFSKCVYQRARIKRAGLTVYRFISGYYPTSRRRQ